MRSLTGIFSSGLMSGAAYMPQSETQCLALDFTDNFWLDARSLYGSALVRDTATPANNYDSTPLGLLTYASPSPKLCRQSDGVYRYGPHNLFLNSASPATQTITVVSGATYTVSITGAGQIVLSGAASATVTAGSPASFTASTTSLVCTVSGGPSTAHVRRTPCSDTYVAAGASAKYELPYEWSAAGVAQGILVEPQATNLCIRCCEFSTSYWGTSSNVTVTSDTTAAPDGATSADTLAMTSAAYHYCQNSTIGAATQAYTASIWLKGTPGDKVGLRVQCADSGNGAAYTLVTLTATWTRYTVTSTITTTAGQSVHMGLETRSYIVPGTGAAVTFQAWGAQLETGSVATSPIITYGSQVTRAADDLRAAQSKFPWAAGAGVLKIDGITTSPTTSGSDLKIVPRSGQTYIKQYLWVPT